MCGRGGGKVRSKTVSSQPSVGACGLYLVNSLGIQGWMVAKSRISLDSELENLAGW